MSKQVKFNRATKDFDVYVNSEYVGSRATHAEAEALADEVAYRMLGGK